MRSYIDGLCKIVEQEKQERELARQEVTASLQTMHPDVKPLEQQLVEFFRTLSPEQLKRPWTMDDIIGSGKLRGKHPGGLPHPQQVSDILKRLNWRKARLYGAHGGKRVWLAPK